MGPVSISAVYPEAVKKALVSFYRKQFQPQKQLAFARKPFSFCEDGNDIQFSTASYDDEFRKLKEYLQFFDVKVPTLYKQYGELCEPGGVVFEDFSVDSNFGDCIDGLVRVDLSRVKMKKRMRYIGEAD